MAKFIGMKDHKKIINKRNPSRLLSKHFARESVSPHSNEILLGNEKIYLNERKYSTSSQPECGGCSSCQMLLKQILRQLNILTKKFLDDHLDEENELDWKVGFRNTLKYNKFQVSKLFSIKYAAMVIDRICVYFFLIATLFSTVSKFYFASIYKCIEIMA